MKTIGNKNPIIFEIIILVIGLLLSGIVAGVINTISDNSDVSASIARILVGLAFLAVFYREFKLGNFNAVLGVEDEETAEMLRQMIISMFSAGVHGKDAVELAAEDSTYQLFDCNYAEEVNELTIDGNVISGTDKDGNEIFSHQYTLIDSIKCDFGAMNEVYEAYFTDETWPMMAIYESDGEEDAFKYFAFAGDSPEETYHIEFRYGSELDNLTAYYDGDYAYWMASGFLKDAPDGMIEDCIALFVAENADSFQGMIE